MGPGGSAAEPRHSSFKGIQGGHCQRPRTVSSLDQQSRPSSPPDDVNAAWLNDWDSLFWAASHPATGVPLLQRPLPDPLPSRPTYPGTCPGGDSITPADVLFQLSVQLQQLLHRTRQGQELHVLSQGSPGAMSEGGRCFAPGIGRCRLQRKGGEDILQLSPYASSTTSRETSLDGRQRDKLQQHQYSGGCTQGCTCRFCHRRAACVPSWTNLCSCASCAASLHHQQSTRWRLRSSILLLVANGTALSVKPSTPPMHAPGATHLVPAVGATDHASTLVGGHSGQPEGKDEEDTATSQATSAAATDVHGSPVAGAAVSNAAPGSEAKAVQLRWQAGFLRVQEAWGRSVLSCQ